MSECLSRLNVNSISIEGHTYIKNIASFALPIEGKWLNYPQASPFFVYLVTCVNSVLDITL